ncbi:cysteine--tRNA ligase [Candidatus Woesearchaeota archaeon]|nr:cysteine--tRNA ligase [Candidatus Woesearchaeota archaeon]
MALRVHNTLSRKLESFKPLDDKNVKLYTCGPTVYNVAHVGNWRAFLFYDLFKRYLSYRGFKVTHVMNITDVDDKIIRDCQKTGLSREAFTKKYTDLFLEDEKTIGILSPDHMPRATEYVGDMISLIQSLMDKGFAYRADEGVYFRVSAFKSYGKLSGIDQEQLLAGGSGRLTADEYDKSSVQDFALWKFHVPADGDVMWDAPFGKGRPGWHIECSAMARRLLGDQLDVHMGGVDLIFPHHENEIAQIEPVSKKRFTTYWLHNEHLLVDGKKMSKSLGNFYTLRDLLAKGHKPLAIRYLFISTHYRQKFNLSMEALHSAEVAVKTFDEFLIHLQDAAAENDNPKLPRLIAKTEKSFQKAMDNDLNISEALAHLHNFMSQINKLRAKLSKKDTKEIKDFMLRINTVLGVMSEHKDEAPKDILDLVAKREMARKAKVWKESDAIRDQLKVKGWYVEDLPQGPRPRRIE